MKGYKIIGLMLFSSIILFGCQSKNVNILNEGEVNVPKEETKKSIKNDSVSLPVTIFEDNHYNKNLGREDSFKKIIVSSNISKINDELKTEFTNLYDTSVARDINNLEEEYKVITLNLEKVYVSENEDTPLESFNLVKGSDLVIGADSLSQKNDFVMKQFEYLSNSYRIGNTLDENGQLLIAVPKEFANEKKLQLKIARNIDDKQDFVYIDVN